MLLLEVISGETLGKPDRGKPSEMIIVTQRRSLILPLFLPTSRHGGSDEKQQVRFIHHLFRAMMHIFLGSVQIIFGWCVRNDPNV